MPKMYIAEFSGKTDKNNHETFLKIGHTGKNDAMKRFSDYPNDYANWDIRILATAYHHDIDRCRGAEAAFQAVYPKYDFISNKSLYIEEKINGVTEIVRLKPQQRYHLIQQVRNLSERWKRECFD